MSFLPILLSKIKLHHVSELGVTCWVGCMCVWGCLTFGILLTQCAPPAALRRQMEKMKHLESALFNLMVKSHQQLVNGELALKRSPLFINK